MLKLCTPQNEMELAFIKSFLVGEGIPFFVHNDHFGSLKVGPSIPLFNAKTIMVADEDFGPATELLTAVFRKDELSSPAEESAYALMDKFRIVLEFLLFSWFLPGRRRRVGKEKLS